MTESEKTTLVPRNREEWHPTGRLRHAVADQLDRIGQRIMNLRDRHAMVRLHGEARTFEARVGDVPDIFDDPREMARQIIGWKAKVRALHAYNSVPDFSPGGQQSRLDEFLAILGTSQGGAVRHPALSSLPPAGPSPYD